MQNDDYEELEVEYPQVQFTFQFQVSEMLLRDASPEGLHTILMEDLSVMVEDSLNDWREQNGVE